MHALDEKIRGEQKRVVGGGDPGGVVADAETHAARSRGLPLDQVDEPELSQIPKFHGATGLRAPCRVVWARAGSKPAPTPDREVSWAGLNPSLSGVRGYRRFPPALGAAPPARLPDFGRGPGLRPGGRRGAGLLVSKGRREHVVHVPRQDEVQLVPQGTGNVFQVLLVLERDGHGLDPGTKRRQAFLLQSGPRAGRGPGA